MKNIFYTVALIGLLASGCQKQNIVQTAPPEPILCTQDAKLCPDGSYVGRAGPKCEFTACPDPKATTTPPIVNNLTSGIKGAITIGPICPVEKNPPDPNCAPRPYSMTILVKSADGQKTITQFTSDSNGNFKLTLGPGIYLLSSGTAKQFPNFVNEQVTVEKNKYTLLNLQVDSGIR
jgi:hypothetical protein